MIPRNVWNGRRLLVTAVVLTLIPVVLMAARGRRILIDGVDGTWTPSGEQVLDVTTDRSSTALTLPMPVRIGNQTFNHLWVNENGFVYLTQGAAPPAPVTHVPSAQSLANIDGNVIAAFYSDVQSRNPEVGCITPRTGCGADVTTASLNLPDDFESDPPPEYHRARRVTWGYFGDDLNYPPGVVVREGIAVDESKRGSFSLRLIDRSNAPNAAGDFDLELAYDGIPWQNRGLVGVKAGGVLLDFAAFYDSFAGDNPPANPAPGETDHPCYEASGVDPSFDPDVPFACNKITVAFRGGVPDLQTYSADISVVNAPPSSINANPGNAFTFNVNIANEDYDNATNVASSMNMPTGWTFVSATPGSTCTASGALLTCAHGSLAANASTNVGLSFRSSVTGDASPSLSVAADQFDPVPTNNVITFQTSIVAVISPAPPSSGRRGGGGSFSLLALLALGWLIVGRRSSSPAR